MQVAEKPVRGQVWLAQQLGVSQPRISKLVKAGRIPRKTAYGEADVSAAKQVLLEGRATNNATAADMEDAGEAGDETAIQALSKSPERIARIKFIIEKTAKVKLERELLAGGFVRKEEIEKDQAARVYSVRAKMQELPLRASLIAMKTEAECELILTEWAREICTYYANGGD